MTYSQLVTDSRFLSKTDSTSYTADQVTLNLNIWYHKIVSMILDSQDGWDWDDTNQTDFPILTVPLVANQRDYELPVSEKILKVKRVDICWDGTGNTCYKAEPIDSGEVGLGLGNDTVTDSRFTTAQPFYDVITNSIWIYPRASAANVTNSGVIRIEWTREPDEFTTADTTQEPGIDEPFHRMLSLGAAFDYALKEGKSDLAQQIKGELVEYEARLRSYYGKKQQDRQLIMKSAYGSDYGK